ncbi:MAG: ATP-binding protein [Bacteroidota bacterium]
MYRFLLFKVLTLPILQLVFICTPLTAISQHQEIIEARWKVFNDALTRDPGNRVSYLDSIDKLVMKMPGVENIREKLAPYKAVIWSSGTEKWRRQQYWWFLCLNARLRNENGLVIFYTEKRQQELGRQNSVSVAFEKMRISYQAHNPKKVAEEYQKIEGYVSSMPQKIDTGKNGPDAYSLLAVQIEVIKSFIALRDTSNVLKLLRQAENINNTILKHKNKYSDVVGLCGQIAMLIAYYGDVFFDKASSAEKKIKALLEINRKPEPATQLAVNMLKYDILEEMVAFYLRENKPEIAAIYLDSAQQYLSAIGDMIELKIKLGEQRSGIYGLQHQYKKAYEQMIMVHALSDSFSDSRQIEISDNMYALANAEFSQEKLVAVTQEKDKITIAGLLTGIALLVVIAALYSMMRARARKARRQLENLNNATQVQVAELEERNRLLMAAEKKKLGMELHDDLAGTLGAVRMQLATEALETTNDRLQIKLHTLGELIGKAYDNTRTKSHELFKAASEETDASFSERIYSIMDTVLPDKFYQKVITIDDYGLKKMGLPVKIQLLRIVQESVANILKHAKAHKVSVSIFEEIGGINLIISDDGKGFDAQAKNKGRGIGMQSIKDRVAGLKGEIEIVSGKTGTKISVRLPPSLIATEPGLQHGTYARDS